MVSILKSCNCCTSVSNAPAHTDTDTDTDTDIVTDIDTDANIKINVWTQTQTQTQTQTHRRMHRYRHKKQSKHIHDNTAHKSTFLVSYGFVQTPATLCNTTQHPAIPCNITSRANPVKWHSTHNQSEEGSATMAITDPGTECCSVLWCVAVCGSVMQYVTAQGSRKRHRRAREARARGLRRSIVARTR